jgi:hypothetical protein
MARQYRSTRTKVRGNPPKAQFPAGLAEIVSETVRLWRKHHLEYDQTKYVVEQARRRLKLQPMGTRRRTVVGFPLLVENRLSCRQSCPQLVEILRLN